MDNRSEIRAFLTSRRARITPEELGITAHGSRRVAGLRRGEVAALAGVSVSRPGSAGCFIEVPNPDPWRNREHARTLGRAASRR